MANGTAQRVETPRPNNTGMPDNLKTGIESLSGFSMDDVRVHYNSSKPATVQALAYTQGTDIHVAPGQEKHLPHEAWHVAQQMAGRVSPTTNINGMPVNDNAALEHEADVMGEKAAIQKMGGKSYSKHNPSYKVAQCYKYKNYTFNKFGELRKWIKRRFFCPNALKKLKESFNMKETLCDNFDISNLETIDAIINILPSKKDDIDKLKTKFDSNTDEEQYKIYIKYFAKISLIKQDVVADENIKDNFFTQDNINTIIAKYFSPFTGANIKNALQFINTYKLNEDDFFNNITIAVKETLSDISFWKMKLNEKLSNINIENIFLTDSDVHTRGVGVCILKFNNGQKYVIKPEDKSLEKAIYGTSENDEGMSLAEKFGNIGTLDIQVSENNGSCVEFFEHNDLKSMKEKEHPYFNTELNLSSNEEKIKDLIYFSSILGLRDLHHENLVYSKHEKKDDPAARNPQLIDAEIAMWYNDEETANPFLFSLDNGEMKGGSSIAKNHYEQLENNVESLKQPKIDKCLSLLETAKTKLQGKTSRVVLISTGNLYIFRNLAYSGKFNKNSKADENLTYIDSIKKRLNDRMGQETNLFCDENHLIEETNNIFLKGQIPFYEYVFNTGVVYQKCNGSKRIPLYFSENLKLDNVINKRIERMVNYVEDELAKKTCIPTMGRTGKRDQNKRMD